MKKHIFNEIDLRGFLSKYSFILNNTINGYLFSIISRISCLIFGIKIGDKCYFLGHARFLRRPKSKIIIGRGCKFISKSTSNLIGINRPCIVSTLLDSAEIFIGDGCGFSGTVIGSFKSIKIGNNVRCGANTLITDSDWHLDDPRAGRPQEVIIEDNVWLGEGVKVLKGVKIGKNSVIGAGSVVTKNVPPNVIAAGNPCKVIKELSYEF